MASIASEPEYTAKEVLAHNTREDCWMVIHGNGEKMRPKNLLVCELTIIVYDITKYVEDHPGGSDILVESAGVDASVEFDNAGHSEEAFDIMAEYRVGKYKGAPKRNAAKPVTLKAAVQPTQGAVAQSLAAKVATTTAIVSVGVFAAHQAFRYIKLEIPAILPTRMNQLSLRSNRDGFGFAEGFLVASTLFTAAGGFALNKLSKLLHFEEGGFMSYAPHKKMPKVAKPNPLLQRGWLDPSTYHALPLTEKILLAPNVYLFVFSLPTPQTVLGLPIGQHLSIKADVNGKSVNRSYTPVSNNADVGKLELVIKCYPDGQLTGNYLANVEVGDEVLFRGPKGAMRYQRGLCKKIGMLAGGTGITPMYQIIRAICEDDRDLTEVSLVYANRTEEDILLRKELEEFARRYPRNLKLHYLLDSAPENWQYGVGYATKDVIAERLPAPSPDTKIMLCGPPGMINAAKESLVSLGFERPRASSQMSDQVFCF